MNGSGHPGASAPGAGGHPGLTPSRSLKNRLARELRRAIGSHGVLVFYSGPPPATADEPANGEKIGSREVVEADLLKLDSGEPLDVPAQAAWGYWRILDNGGLCVLQGDAPRDAAAGGDP